MTTLRGFGFFLPAVQPVRACRACGCTENRACVTNGQPCGWAEQDLCTACVEILDGPPAEDPDKCPICAVIFKPEDLCALDVEEGICHAECLRDAPIVDLDTGEPLPEGTPAPTPFRYDSLAQVKVQAA